jgi:hypothetical protein
MTIKERAIEKTVEEILKGDPSVFPGGYTPQKHLVEGIRKLVEKIIPIYEQALWVDVDDELPPEGVPVTVFIDRKSVFSPGYTYTGTARIKNEKFICDFTDEELYTPDAWRPLPTFEPGE